MRRQVGDVAFVAGTPAGLPQASNLTLPPCETAQGATAILNREFIMLGTVSRAAREVLMEARSVSEVFLIFGLSFFFCGISSVALRTAGGADTKSDDQGTRQLRPVSNVASMPLPSAGA